MAVFMITYDIRIKDRDEYPEIYKTIKSLGSWCHPLESVWFVDTTTKTATQIRSSIETRMRKGDNILVIRCVNERSGYYNESCIDWMRSADRTWKTPPIK